MITLVDCPNKCGGIIGKPGKFCPRCGAPFPAPPKCNRCKKLLNFDEQFCGDCGWPRNEPFPKPERLEQQQQKPQQQQEPKEPQPKYEITVKEFRGMVINGFSVATLLNLGIWGLLLLAPNKHFGECWKKILECWLAWMGICLFPYFTWITWRYGHEKLWSLLKEAFWPCNNRGKEETKLNEGSSSIPKDDPAMIAAKAEVEKIAPDIQRENGEP